jgi:hypothetical protein
MTVLHQRSFPLPFGRSANFKYGPDGVSCVIRPEPAAIRSSRARRRFIDAYRTARRDFMADLAVLLNGPVIVADEMGVEVIRPGTRQ